MPWKETSSVKQREEFVAACVERVECGESMSELCRRFGVSRKNGYKWLNRFLGDVDAGFEDQSRRPHYCPTMVDATVAEAIVDARKRRPTWGPKKLRAAFQRANPTAVLPSVGTFARILKRHGLVRPRRRAKRTPASTDPLGHATAPNVVWCIDFKGDFAVGTSRCYPLTITDAYSRYLIACIALPNTKTKTVIRALLAVFREFGLPDRIRSDNGSPFASPAPCGLSELSIWWTRLGIVHERIEPGQPQQNGRHERFHLTLKQATAMPPRTSRRAQQRAFDLFRAEYNHQRPHEALDNAVPADIYVRSRRRFGEPKEGPDFEYEYLEYETVFVDPRGAIRWAGHGLISISAALRGQVLGLRWSRPHWEVYLGRLHLGRLERKRRIYRFVRTDDATNALNQVSPMS